MATLPVNDRRSGPFVASAGQTAFPADFPMMDNEAVFVARWRVVDDAVVKTVLSIGDFTISADTGETFTVNLVLPALAGDVYVVFGLKPVERDQAYTSQVHPDTLEGDLTRIEAQIQEVRRDAGQAVRAPLYEAGGAELPSAADRADSLFVWSADGLSIRGDVKITDWDLVLTALPAILAARAEALAAIMASVQAYIQANINFHTRTLNWIAACVLAGSAPSIARAMLMDRTIRRLDAAGLFDHLAGYFMIGESKAQTLVNIAAPGTVAVEDGGVLTFVADHYISGGGVVAVDTNVAIPAAGYAQDSAFMLVRQVSNTQDGNNRMIGGRQSRAYVVPSTDQSHLRIAGNAAAFDDTTEFTPNGVGAYGFIRRDSTGFTPMFGTEERTPIVRASTSLAAAGNEVLLLGGGAQRGTGKGAYFAFGTAVTLPQWVELVDASEDHGREIGAFL